LESYGIIVEAVETQTKPAVTKAIELTHPIFELYDASIAKCDRALQPLKPYYVQAKNGVVLMFAKVGKTYVVIQVKIGEVCNTMQVQTVKTITGARVAIEGYASVAKGHAFSGYATFQNAVATRAECVSISFKHGAVCVRDMTGTQIAFLQLKMSEAAAAIRMMMLNGVSGTKQAVLELVQKVVPVLSASYGKACDTMRLLGSKTHDGCMYIAVQVNDKLFAISIRMADVVAFAKSQSIEMSHILVDKCMVGKTNALQALGNMKTTASTNGRNLAANPRARVTAASAAGGAVALGASGGAAGLVAGGALGAACALPAAFFTFGLSIPVGALLGAGTGACIGTAAGGTTGLVTGGAAGYTAHAAHANKEQITAKAKAYKDIAAASSNKLRANIMAVAQPQVCTGGTDA